MKTPNTTTQGYEFWHRQERDGTIVQTTHEQDDKNRTTIVLVTPFIVPLFYKCQISESEFDIYKIPRNQEKLYIDAKIRENYLLLNHWLTMLKKV
jgi:hypothetical protein